MLHLTASQLSRARIHTADVRYLNPPLSTVLLLGQLLSATRETSERGMAMLSLRVQDSTGRFVVKVYEREEVSSVCQLGAYVKLAANVKCGGPAYRPEIRLMGTAMRLLEDFNELTEHLLGCMRTAVLAGE